jgi:hypothetical protein
MASSVVIVVCSSSRASSAPRSDLRGVRIFAE